MIAPTSTVRLRSGGDELLSGNMWEEEIWIAPNCRLQYVITPLNGTLHFIFHYSLLVICKKKKNDDGGKKKYKLRKKRNMIN